MAVFHSQYTAQQIENEIANGVPYIRDTDKHWMRWDILTSAYVDTGIVAQGQFPNLMGASNPTTSTAGIVGQLYFNTTQASIWLCTAASGSTYTWLSMGGGSTLTLKTVNGQTIVGSGDVITAYPIVATLNASTDWNTEIRTTSPTSTVNIPQGNNSYGYSSEIRYIFTATRTNITFATSGSWKLTDGSTTNTSIAYTDLTVGHTYEVSFSVIKTNYIALVRKDWGTLS